MSAKHTGGDWVIANTDHWENGAQFDICAHIDDQDGHFVTLASLSASGGSFSVHGDPWTYEITEEEAKANATLLVAAPRLLCALKTLHDKTAELIAHLQATDRLRPCFNLPALAEAQEAIKAAEDAQ